MFVVLTLPVGCCSVLNCESFIHVDFICLFVCYSCVAPPFSFEAPFLFFSSLTLPTPWDDRNGWLGVKHQITYLTLPSTSMWGVYSETFIATIYLSLTPSRVFVWFVSHVHHAPYFLFFFYIYMFYLFIYFTLFGHGIYIFVCKLYYV